MLLSIGLETALSMRRLTFTRFSFGNGLLNAHDLLLLLALVAVLVTCSRKRQQAYVPMIVVGLLWVLLFGFSLSVVKIPGNMYEIVRMLRWGLTLPLYYFVGRNGCADRQTLDLLLWTLMLGVLAGAGTHVLGSCVLLLEGRSLESIRDYQYLGGAVPPWVIAAIARGTPWTNTRRKRLLVSISVFMGLLSIAISLARSLWIAVVVAIPLTWIVFRRPRTRSAEVHLDSHGLTVVGLGCVTVALLTLLSGNILAELTKRLLSVGLLFRPGSSAFGDRKAVFLLDSHAWLHCPLVGQGLAYYAPLVGNASYAAILDAWGHLGYITTLAQLGLVGFGVFYLWLPAAVMKNAKLLWASADDTTRQLGLLGGAWMIMVLIEFLMSGNFIAIGMSGAGLTWGALAAHRALLQGERSDETTHQSHTRRVQCLEV
jgi:hypothetical protein